MLITTLLITTTQYKISRMPTWNETTTRFSKYKKNIYIQDY